MLKNLDYQKKKYILAILVFLIAFAVYLKTLSPTIGFEDSGEFVTISYVLGDAHPPGYPLYTLIGKLITLLPISSIAFRVITLSAYCGAGCAVLIYFIILLLLENSGSRTSVLASATAALCFAFSSVLWDLSIIDEVYSMSTFFMLFQIFMLLKWEKSLKEPYNNIYEKYSIKRMGYLYAFSMLYGISFGVHHVALLIMPAFFYFILINDHKILLDPTSSDNAMVTLKNALVLVFMWCLGFLIYFYLPVRSVNNPTIDWGDPENIAGFIDVFMRRQYGGVSGLLSTFPQIVKKIPFFDLIDQYSPILVIPVLFGIWKSFKLNIKHFVFISCFFFSYSIGFLILIDPPIPYELPLLLQTFYIPVHLILAIWMGFGFTYAMDLIAELIESKNTLKKAVAFALTIGILLLPILPFTYGLETHDMAKHYFAYDYAANMLRSTERDGVIFTFLAQDTFPLWYLTHVEGRRKDVVVVHQRLLSLPWHSKQVKNNCPDFFVEYPKLDGYNAHNLMMISDIATQTIIMKNPTRPIYFTNFRTQNETKRYPLKETGLIAQISSASTPPRIVGRDIFHNYVYRHLFRDGEVTKDNRVREITSIYVYGHQFECAVYLDYRKLVYRAVSLLKQGMMMEPGNPYLYRNLAEAYRVLGMRPAAINILKEYLKIDNTSKEAEITKNMLYQITGG
ncbi:MAG: DUF2723 domain-containing protein [Candidatus Firestonebacteria bacterium]|nr:DUF2723 domain-containing protein [Candidatus Firestonebacteria bacterium]